MDGLLEKLLQDRAKLAAELTSVRATKARSTGDSQALDFRVAALSVRIESFDRQIADRRRTLGIDLNYTK
jgi:hypothetical protein